MRQVRAFVAVAQLKSFTRAATLLHLSQPALTVQVRKLEEVLAIRLLDRDSRTVEITRVGRELLPIFQRILRELDAVLVDTRDLSTRRHGVVRIAALPTFAAGRLPPIISQFRQANPRMLFVVKDAIARRVTACVRSEEVDIGVTGGEVSDPDLEIVHQSQDRMHVVYPMRHPIGRRKKLGLEDLAQYPLVLMDPDTSVRAIVDAAFAAGGRTPIQACEATYMMTAVGMVRAGLGLTILPGSANEIKAEPSLRSRPIDDAAFARPISIITKRHRTLPPASHSFLAEMVASMDCLTFKD